MGLDDAVQFPSESLGRIYPRSEKGQLVEPIARDMGKGKGRGGEGRLQYGTGLSISTLRQNPRGEVTTFNATARCVLYGMGRRYREAQMKTDPLAILLLPS